MPKSHPAYPAVFREQILELVRAGRAPEKLAREFEPTAQTIRNWMTQAERDWPSPRSWATTSSSSAADWSSPQ
jgi:transposase